MEQLTQVLAINSEKKHSVRYDAVGASPVVTGVYVMKAHLSLPYPKELELTLKERKEV